MYCITYLFTSFTHLDINLFILFQVVHYFVTLTSKFTLKSADCFWK